jgi:4-hydroxymandelate oxidase
MTEDLVTAAEGAGYRALVVTVDAPLLGRRERDLRNPFALPEGVKAVHFPDAPTAHGLSPMSSYICQPGLSWKDLAWLRGLTRLPILLKGVVRADDAERAVGEGVDGVWVSNHGGRQLDGAIPTVEALPEVVAAVRGRVPVVVDGGVRRGADVLKGLALGANAVAVGRPILWGLAAGGEDGVRQVFDVLRDELSLAMALAGCRSIKDITPDLVR